MSEVTPNRNLAKIYLQKASAIDPVKIKQMMWETARKQLPELIKNRHYGGLRTCIRSLIDLGGWRETLDELITIGDESILTLAKLRDGLFHVFVLGSVLGLDINPLAEFYPFDGHCYDDIQYQIQERVIECLTTQVAKGNTFYLDAEVMRNTSLVVVLPDILKVRKREIYDLSDAPHLNEILATYYGFNILTSTRNLVQSKVVFEDMCRTLGKNVQVRGKRISFRESIWDHTGPETRNLLINTIRLTLVKTESVRAEAAWRLGETGDSRAWKILYESGRNIKDWNTRDSIKSALGKIGKPMEGRGDD
jgi:hypothetical protein